MFTITTENLLHFLEYFDDEITFLKNFPLRLRTMLKGFYFFLEIGFKTRVCIIHGFALYMGKYGNSRSECL